MAEVIEAWPTAVDVSGNLTIVAVSGSAAATTAAAVKAGKRITNSFTSNGWQPTSSQATEEDARLANPNVLTSLGRVTVGFTVTYIESSSPESADVILGEAQGDWTFYERRAVPNQTDFAATQKVIVHEVTLGAVTRVPAEAGKFTKTRIGTYRQPPREITLT